VGVPHRLRGHPDPDAFLAAWATAILLLKSLKIRAQRAALRLRFMPTDPGFTVSSATAERLIEAIETSVEEPERFMVLARVLRALKSVRNVGRVADVDEMLATRAEQDENIVEGGYTLVRGFVWAIPVLGFIGTIVGLTAAISRFGGVLGQPGLALESITAQLTEVIAGLDTAFVTTGEGLVAALAIHLLQVFVRRQDETFLDEVREATTAEIVARVRLVAAKEG
jgi:biopolymer transport protein ExbB/TolQ